MTSARQIRREAEQLRRLCRVDGALDEGRVRLVVGQVAASGYHRAPALLSQFLRLVKTDVARRTAHVASAAPLDGHARAEVEAMLTRKYGRSVAIDFTVDSALIGGMRVSVGSDVYDGSVRGRLNAVDARF